MESDMSTMTKNSKYEGIGKGWHPLLDSLFEILEETDPTCEILQVKEKFGELRIYTTPLSRRGSDAVMKAEQYSRMICESCGAKGQVRNVNRWIKCICEDCLDAQQI